MKKILLIAMALSALGMVLAGCGAKEGDAATTPPAATETPATS
jgi:nitrous oxide reductase accessory protein NosL